MTGPASELVLSLLDRAGHENDVFAWPAAGIVYHDQVNPLTGNLSGSPLVQAQWEAELRVPVSESTRYLVFTRSDVSPGGVQAFNQRILAVYDLRPEDGGPTPPWPLPWPDPPEPIPKLPHFGEEIVIPRRPYGPQKNVLVPGALLSTRTIIDSGRLTDCFDVVIMAEGFRESEMGDFDFRANLLAYGLALTPPYSDYLDRINVYSARTISVESGLTLPPEGIYKNTFFRAEGYWNGKPAPTFIGTGAIDIVNDTAGSVRPLSEVDLIFIIVNYATQAGASADPQNRLVFITEIADPDKFINTAAHESCHVVAGTCEEYIGCTLHDPARKSPNQVTQDDVDANNVWWTTQAFSNELNLGGTFNAIHRLGDPVDGDCQPVMPPELRGLLGLYWGCQDTIPPASPMTGCNAYCDTRGGAFYRSMAECKMRRLRYSFCRVCRKLISDAILTVAP